LISRVKELNCSELIGGHKGEGYAKEN